MSWGCFYLPTNWVFWWLRGKPLMRKTGIYTLLAALLFTTTASGDDLQEKIRWRNFRQGLAQSKQTGKTQVIYFYSETCPSCTEMEKTTWKDPRVIDEINNRYTPIKVNVNKEQQIASLYKVYYLPTTWFIKPDGKPFGNRSGYIPADKLLKIFSYMQK